MICGSPVNAPKSRSACDKIADRIEAAKTDGRLPLSVVAPCARTIYRLIDRDPELRRELDRRNGKDPADKCRQSVKVRPLVDKLLAEVQIDDAELAINVWADKDGKIVVGHPTLTLIIDVRTRMVLGFYLSLRPPCAETACLAMLNAIQEKPAPGPGRPMTPWPAHGLPKLLLSDCGKNFKAVAFTKPCNDLGFEPRQAPPYFPRLKGHIERLIRTLKRLLYARLLKEFCENTPGGDDRKPAVADLSLKDWSGLSFTTSLIVTIRIPTAASTGNDRSIAGCASRRIRRRPDDARSRPRGAALRH